MSSGGLADTYFLFHLLGIPFTITNVLIYAGISLVFYVIVMVLCASSG